MCWFQNIFFFCECILDKYFKLCSNSFVCFQWRILIYFVLYTCHVLIFLIDFQYMKKKLSKKEFSRIGVNDKPVFNKIDFDFCCNLKKKIALEKFKKRI